MVSNIVVWEVTEDFPIDAPPTPSLSKSDHYLTGHHGSINHFFPVLNRAHGTKTYFSRILQKLLTKYFKEIFLRNIAPKTVDIFYLLLKFAHFFFSIIWCSLPHTTQRYPLHYASFPIRQCQLEI